MVVPVAGICGGVAAGAAVLFGGRRYIQGYWYDNRCPPVAPGALNGKVCLITGGNQGIGFHVAKKLRDLGGSVTILCRSDKRAREAAEALGIEFVAGFDLCSQKAVAEGIKKIKAKFDHVDILVCNAGTAAGDDAEVWQANVLGHYQLCEALESSLSETARVVFVSSGAHSRASINFDDPFVSPGGSAYSAYMQSKLAQLLHTKALAGRWASAYPRRQALACTPGFCNTSIFTVAGWKYYLLYPVMLALARPAATGAEVVNMCCTSPSTVSGKYYSNCLEKPSTGNDGISNDPDAARRLMEVLARQQNEARFP